MRRLKNYFPIDNSNPCPVVVTLGPRRLQFSEVDALAVAWHGHYPAFFELAHTELMRKVGLTYNCYRQHNVGAPMVQCHIDYFSSLLLDEAFTTRAKLLWSDGARLNVEYAVIHANGEIAATGYTVQMFINLENREPYILIPPIFEECRVKWRDGSFND